MKHFLIVISLLTLSLASSAQTARQYLKAADAEFQGNDYYSAMKHYQMAMEIVGEKPELLYKYAEAARLFAAYTFADTAYTKVLNSSSSANYPLTRFWLGSIKKKIGKYQEARQFFQEFIDSTAHMVDASYLEEAKKELENLDWILSEHGKIDPNVKLSLLPDSINSPFAEFNPTVHGGFLYFSSQRKEAEVFKGKPTRHISQIYKTPLDSISVSALEINEPLRHTANICFNSSNTRVYYTICNYVGETEILKCKIYYRNITANGQFGAATALPEFINHPGSSTTHPHVAIDPATGLDKLFFSSDMPGGKGGMDIWTCTIFKDGTFDKPFNFETINTSGDEVTPFYHSASKTLYFSTNGRQGFGGFDIFKTVFAKGQWTAPTLMPEPLNSSYDDLFFWLNPSQSEGYLTSNRLGSKTLEPEFEACCTDLYEFRFKLLHLNALTFDIDKEPLEGVKITLLENQQGDWVPIDSSFNETGNEHRFDLRRGEKYLILAQKPGFLPLKDTVDLSLATIDDPDTLTRRLYLLPDLLDLHITTFNKRTMRPLKGVEVRIAVDGQEIAFDQNPTGNEVNFKLERGKLYEVIGAKVAYFSDTLIVDLRNNFTDSKLDGKLLLSPKELEDFPPLQIYFDNDMPDPRSWATTTNATYEELWEAYMDRKDVFIREYSKVLTGRDSFLAANRIRAFFEREVKNGWESLKVFTESLQRILEEGEFQVELTIQGFASPRASELYNYNLSQRRADCLKNHFETWNGGVLKPYIDNGTLVLKVVGYGEKLAPAFISDRLDDERESIYSLAASAERKVAIIGVRKLAHR